MIVIKIENELVLSEGQVIVLCFMFCQSQRDMKFYFEPYFDKVKGTRDILFQINRVYVSYL